MIYTIVKKETIYMYKNSFAFFGMPPIYCIRKEASVFIYITHIFFVLNFAFIMEAPYWAYLPVAFGSILPDIDHSKAIINKFLLFPLYWAFKGHRKITHSLLGFMIMTAFAYFIAHLVNWPIEVGLYFGIGYLSHIILDMLTPSGCPVFYPYKKKCNILSIRTGSIGEYLICGFMIYMFFMKVLR